MPDFFKAIENAFRLWGDVPHVTIEMAGTWYKVARGPGGYAIVG